MSFVSLFQENHELDMYDIKSHTYGSETSFLTFQCQKCEACYYEEDKIIKHCTTFHQPPRKRHASKNEDDDPLATNAKSSRMSDNDNHEEKNECEIVVIKEEPLESSYMPFMTQDGVDDKVKSNMCLICAKDFKNFQGLKKHFGFWHPEIDYILWCGLCSRPHLQKSQLDLHYKDKHGIE